MKPPFTATSPTAPAEPFTAGWNRFWFTPADPRPLCALRIGVGLFAALYFLSWSPDLPRWLAADGLLPVDTVAAFLAEDPTALSADPTARATLPIYLASPLQGCTSDGALWTFHYAAILAAAALACGLFTRTATIMTLAALLSYVHRAPLLAGLSEPVLAFLLFYLCFAPAGVGFSLDRRLFSGEKPPLSTGSGSIAANIALRLIQVHLAAFYLMIGACKLYGDGWWDGLAIWHLLAQTQSRPLDLTFLRDYELLLNGWTHFVLYTQLAFGVLIWNHCWRPYVLGAAALMWLSLIPATGQPQFCLLMILASGVFLPEETWRSRNTKEGNHGQST